MNLILVAETDQGLTRQIMQAGVSAYNQEILSSRRVSLEVVTFSQFEKQQAGYDPETSLVFVAVAEELLSYRSKTDRAVLLPCQSVQVAQRIASSNKKHRVFLVVVPPKCSPSGLDVVAASLSGISGVADERALIEKLIFDKVINYRPNGRRHKSMLLVGYLTDQIARMKSMIKEWQLDDKTEERFDLPCWRASVALAQLDRLETLVTSGNLFSFEKLADALNFARPTTSFHFNPSDLRHILSVLSKRWMGEGHARYERFNLPEYARRNGFPLIPPVIAGMSNADEIAKLLYSALEDLEVFDQGRMGSVDYAQIRLRAELCP